MVDFTTVNPKKGFKTGQKINDSMIIGINKGFYVPVGKGLLTTFVSNALQASGTYSQLGASGNFDINITPSGNLFQVAVNITGSFSGQSRQFLATASQVKPNTVRLDQQNGKLSLLLEQDNGGTFTDPKIEITINWESTGLYVKPA